MRRRTAGLLTVLPATFFVALAGAPADAQLSAPEAGQLTTDGGVAAIVSSNGRVYVGGGFGRVGPYTGSGVGIDRITGRSIGLPALPSGVSAVVPDGAGGWYVGGEFAGVADMGQSNLVHVRADKSVDPAFDARANGRVDALALDGGTLYVGGAFTRIGGALRQSLAAVDARTGGAAIWNPKLSGADSRHVSALAVSGSMLYVAGGFTSIGGQPRNGLAAIDRALGTATTWNPDARDNAGGGVRALAVSGSTVYAGGEFESIGGQSRAGLAALDADTGVATPWNPNPSNGDRATQINALSVADNLVYVGGAMASIGGQKRSGLAAIDSATGAANDWDPKLTDESGNLSVDALVVADGVVYAGGQFTATGTVARNGLVALDPVTAAPTTWNPRPDGAVRALAVSGDVVYAGGEFVMLGGVERHGLAAFNARTGALTSWNPDAGRGVGALALAGGTLYVGGVETIGGQPRSGLAALDLKSGRPLPWKPRVNGEVRELAVGRTTVYVGGTFKSAGGRQRMNLAAFRRSSGAVTAWNPKTDAFIGALAVSGSSVYVGGQFARLGGQVRTGLAEVDARSGRVEPWNPKLTGFAPTVYAITFAKSGMYVGGIFKTIGGQARSDLAELSPQTGSAAKWNPRIRSIGDKKTGVTSIALDERRLYAGGGFASAGGRSRPGLAAVSIGTGAVDPWRRRLGYVSALGIAANTLYAGLEFKPGLIRLPAP